MRHPATSLIALFAGAALMASPAATQSRGPAAAAVPGAGHLSLQHTFPLAGGRLLVVAEGLAPAEVVVVQLIDAVRAAPSARDYLVDLNSPQRVQLTFEATADGNLPSSFTADERGRVVLDIALDDPADVDRDINLQVTRKQGTESSLLELHVQPPMIVLPGPQGLQRINLLSGAPLLPAIPGEGGLRGLALSDTGTLGYLLRDGGRLEKRAAYQWDAPPLAVRTLDPASDLLTARIGGGAAFVLARPAGQPFAPAASLLFIEEDRAPLMLEAMGQPVGGRRVALTDDGLTAFVAEDDLIVREVDLVSGTARGLITAGLSGDGAIADLLMAGRKLMIATRGPLGRPGALTVFDLDSGAIDTLALQVDPLRLVSLDHGVVVVLPATGGVFQTVEGGLVSRLLSDPRAAGWLDAVAWDGAAMLLAQAADGSLSLLRFEPLTALFRESLAHAPAATRIAAAPAGAGPIVLLGGAAVHVFDPASGSATLLDGVAAAPDAPFVVLP